MPLPIYLIRRARSFTNKLNRSGEREHPCLSPQLTVNQSVVTLFTLTQADTDLYNDVTAVNILLDTPMSFNLDHSLFLSIQS